MLHKPTPGTPEEWMVRARSNLIIAGAPKLEGALWEEYCFQAHQAIEKAIKAVYQRRGLLFKYTHDLKELAMGLEKGGIKVPAEVRMAVVLNPYAHEARYPGPLDPSTEKEYRDALRIATAVVEWAETIVTTPDKPGGSLLKETPASYRAKKSRKKRGGK